MFCKHPLLLRGLLLCWSIRRASPRHVFRTALQKNANHISRDVFVPRSRSGRGCNSPRRQFRCRHLTRLSLCFAHVFSRDCAGFVLDAIDLRISPGKLVGVVGPVGSSKSSLLMAMLREISPENAGGMGVAITPGVSGEVGACRGCMDGFRQTKHNTPCRLEPLIYIRKGGTK